MTNKDKALVIVNQLFELSSTDTNVTFSGHIGEMVISYEDKDGGHFHISDHMKFSEQLQDIIVCLDKIKNLEGK